MQQAPMPELTERQRQCLEGFLLRKTAKEIGRELGITHHAVEKHLLAARNKMGTSDTAEAARRYAAMTATVAPYYRSAEVPYCSFPAASPDEPRREALRLRDVATGEPVMIQSLSPMQTLAAIGLCGLGMITILSLIVAVAQGAAQLAP